MSETIREWSIRIVLLSVLFSCVCLAGINLYSKDAESEADKFDWELFNSIYRSMEADAASSIADLVERYEQDVFDQTPIAPPDPELPIIVGETRTTLLQVDKFSSRRLDRLVPVERQINGRRYIAYPITVRENRKNRERVIKAADGSIIAGVPAPKGYDPYWHVRDELDRIEKDIALTARDKELSQKEEWLKAVYDPARVVSHFDLVTEEATLVIAAEKTVLQIESETGDDSMMMRTLSYDPDELYISDCSQSGTTFRISIHVPDGTGDIDLFTTSDLMSPGWEIAATDLTPQSNLVEWVSGGTTQDAFYRVADQTDTDGDGLSDAAENWVYGTDPSLVDTDGDGMDDEWEVQNGLDALNASDEVDSDGDDFIDIYEYENDSDPSDPLDTPAYAFSVTGTIQQTVDLASDYDVIEVPAGTYAGSGNRDISFNGKKIMLHASGGAGSAIVDAQDSGRGFIFAGGENRHAVIHGVQIGNGNPASGIGGGILASNASPRIQSCIITNCSGGGISCEGGSSTLISDCTIIGNINDGEDGGGIRSINSSPKILNCLISGNNSFYDYGLDEGGLGGGIYVRDDSGTNKVLMADCTIEDNYANSGGGVAIGDAWDKSSAEVVDCLISDNSASNYGGGVYVDAYYSQFDSFTNLVMSSTVVCGNTINDSVGTQEGGGGLNCMVGTLILSNCAFVGNDGAAFGGGALLQFTQQVRFENCTFHDNAAVTGTEIFRGMAYEMKTMRTTQSGIDFVEMEDSVFWNADHANALVEAHDGAWISSAINCVAPVDLEPMCIYGYGGAVNMITDNPGLWPGDWHLWPKESTAGDQGVEGGEDDLDGEPRPGGEASDIGCDEFTDTDSDGIADWWEVEHFGNLSYAEDDDPDGDNVCNLYEYVQHSDPNSDSGDLDQWNCQPDGDGDGLKQPLEMWGGTDDSYWDSDGDGMSDGWEWEYGRDPNSYDDPATYTDSDGWTDQEEADQGTDPDEEDTDGDGTIDSEDADPLDASDDRIADDTTTTEMTLLVGDRSGSHTERYKLVVEPYSVFMSHVSDEEFEFSKTIRVPRGKTYDGYLQSLPDDDDDGDYTADVYGSGVQVDDADSSLPDGRILGGHHEDSGFNDGRLEFTVTIAGTENDEESVNTTNEDAEYSEVGEPINTINGNVTLSETDLVWPQPGPDLVVERNYNSHLQYSGPIGQHWTHGYDYTLEWTNTAYRGVSADWARLRTGNGRQFWFRDTGTNGYLSPPGVNAELCEVSGDFNGYKVIIEDKTQLWFSGAGRLYRISDNTGNSLEMSYLSGRLSRVTHDNGNYLQYSWVPGTNLLRQVQNSIGDISVLHFYGSANNLTNVNRYAANAPIQSTAYEYGPLGAMTNRVNGVGDTVAHEYNTVTNAAGVVFAKGVSSLISSNVYDTQIYYDTTNNQSIVSIDRGDTVIEKIYRYDTSNFRISGIETVGSDERLRRITDGNGDATRLILENTNTGAYAETAIGYDSEHRPLNSAHGLNASPLHTTTIARDPQTGDPLEIADPAGHRVSMTWSNHLPLTVGLWPQSNTVATTTFSYSNGLLASVENADGDVWNYERHPDGRIEKIIPPAGPTTTVSHVENWNERRTDMEVGGRQWTFHRNALDMVYSAERPDGATNSVQYDAVGNITNTVDFGGRHTAYTYGPTRKLQSVVRDTTGLAVTNRFEYDLGLNTLTIHDGRDLPVEHYTLDPHDRVVAVDNIEGQTANFEWLVGDYLASVTRFDGSVVSNQWDRHGRLAARHWPDATNSFGYYPNGVLMTAANGDTSISNTVDGADRLLRQEIDLGAVSAAMEYDYTLAGLPTNAVCSVGGFSIATERDFDPAGRLEVLSSDAGDFELGYDPQSGLPASISNSVSGVNAVYEYNSLGQVSNIVWRKSDGTVLQSHALSYDNADMVAEIQREDGSSRQFGYDGLDRLVSEQSGGSTVQYDYDRSGNRTNRTVNGVDTAYALGSGNRLLSFGASGSFSHDAAGNATNIVYNDGRELAIEWNGKYQITAVSTNGVVAEEYGYDAAGRRAWIVSGGTTNYMVYDGPHCVAEVDSSGNPLKSYTWGPGIDNLLSMTVYGASETNTYYALTDHFGTVTALADDTGAIVESYEYDAWGNITVYDENDAVIPQSQYGNRFTFQGREYSWATGLYNFRARWYDPVTGRWLSKDPIGISGGLNQYVFCGNNPVNFLDPWGLCESRKFPILGIKSMIVIAGGIEFGVITDSTRDFGFYLNFSGGIGVGGSVKNILLDWILKGEEAVKTVPGTIRDQRGTSEYYAQFHAILGTKSDLSSREKPSPDLDSSIGGGVMRDNMFVLPLWNYGGSSEVQNVSRPTIYRNRPVYRY